jgi:hypothetical protein
MFPPLTFSILQGDTYANVFAIFVVSDAIGSLYNVDILWLQHDGDDGHP